MRPFSVNAIPDSESICILQEEYTTAGMPALALRAGTGSADVENQIICEPEFHSLLLTDEPAGSGLTAGS
jgi:hypothetical protein